MLWGKKEEQKRDAVVCMGAGLCTLLNRLIRASSLSRYSGAKMKEIREQSMEISGEEHPRQRGQS